MVDLVGIGLYTPAEASRLLRLPAAKISRWLRGHTIGNRHYEPLWTSQVDLGDGSVLLGFRDLMEARVAKAFIDIGVSAQKVRAAIELAKEVIGNDHPLSTNRFRTDGRAIFLTIDGPASDAQADDDDVRLLDLFRRQYEFKKVLDPILRTVEFGTDGSPSVWWPSGRRLNVVVDPTRSFGRPIDAATSVPTGVLATAARGVGVSVAAQLYEVPESSIRRALEFEQEFRAAA